MTLLRQTILPPRQTPIADRTSVLRSAIIRLGHALSSSQESSTNARSRGSPSNTSARPPASIGDTTTPSHGIRRATSFTRSSSSPRRRTSSVPPALRSSAQSSQTPRRGEKTKRQRLGLGHGDVINSATLPDAIDERFNRAPFSNIIDDRTSHRQTINATNHFTTDFLGWRRLHFDEIVSIRVRQTIIIVIPTDVRSDNDQTKKM